MVSANDRYCRNSAVESAVGGSSYDTEPGSGASGHRFRFGGTRCELAAVIAGVSTGLGERVSGGGSAAALDAEFVALGVGHHDPTTRRGLASVVNDPRTEEQYPVDFLVL
jgi:hypothetical protein